MKKLSLILTVIMSISLIACGQTQNKEKQQQQEQKSMKTLVTYFSASGVTAKVAHKLATMAGADLREIEPEVRYTDADLDWRNDKSRSSLEMKDLNSRPAITNKLSNMADYDVVYVGFPIWWYTAPTIINTFLEAYDFTGKTIVPFATSGGSSIEKACKDLQAKYPNYKFAEGRLLNDFNDAAVEAWVKAIK